MSLPFPLQIEDSSTMGPHIVAQLIGILSGGSASACTTATKA